MDSGRAERHLRLAAEAILRRALTLPRDSGEVRPQEIVTTCAGRLDRIATTLIAAGAIGADRAEVVVDEFQAALDVRYLGSRAAGQLFTWSPRPPGPAAGPTRPPAPGAAPGTAPRGIPASPVPDAGPGTGTSTGPPAGPERVIPVGRMLPFRDGNGTGELYVMSLVVTAAQAAASAVAQIRPVPGAARAAPRPVRLVPFEAVTAHDEEGTSYHIDAHGGVMRPGWTGLLKIRPAPPRAARWLELSARDGGTVRIDLTGTAEAPGTTVEPFSAPPGEQMLENVAQHVLAVADEYPRWAAQTAEGIGDMVSALEAVGALSPFSPTPGHLATVCERLGISDHGVTARPTAGLPEPWLGVLACHGRRHRPTVRDGIATVAAALPELDGARITLTGLHTAGGHTFLHVFGCGLPQALPPRRWGAVTYPSFGWWLRDDAGRWHVLVQRHWEEEIGAGESSIEMRVVPALGHETASVTIFVATLTKRASVRVPLSWWASP